MFKWKSAEKLEKPKITEVIVEEKLNATTIVEQAEPVVLPSVPSTSAVDTNSVSDVPLPAALPSEQPSVDLDPLAKAQKAEHDEMPPELGDRYEVIEFIGSGGMGSVWKVYDKELKGTFAVKVLKPELLADAIAVKRFEKEANLASDLTHANIAAIFGPGTDSQGRPFIIMGYVDGDSLADILACEGKLSEERALDIFTQICEALSHSHMKGIIHRDIKPSNIIISKTESGGDMVHIVDFGIARCIYDEVTKTQALTKAVDIFGSPRYMSPEQFLGNSVTGQSDIYSLGCVFYEMLTGAPPFTDENPVKLILQHISETPDLSKVPLRLQLLLSLCLEKEPERRVPTVNSLLARLTSLVRNQSGGTAQPVQVTPCTVAVGLILLSGMASTCTDTGQSSFPYSSLLLTAVWLHVTKVNRDNAGRSLNYKIMELTFFIASCAAVVTDSVALLHIQFLGLLITPFLAATSIWLLLQPKVLEIYSHWVSVISSVIAIRHTNLVRRHEKLIENLGTAVTGVLSTFVVMLLLMLIVLPTLFMACVPGFDTVVASSLFIPCAAIFTVLSFMIIVIRLMDDITEGTRTVMQSLRRSIKVQSFVAVVTVLTTLAASYTFGRGGFNQFVRQCYPCRAVGAKQELLRLEASNYPDSLLSNQARVIAASHLFGRYRRISEALVLCNQIIESKRERDPVTLASAYAIRARILFYKNSVGAGVADLEKGMRLLENLQQPSLFDLESNIARLVQPFLVENEVLGLGLLAVQNNDLALGRRAHALATKTGVAANPRNIADLDFLKTRINALSVPKPAGPADNK